jgi:hypothetical protein
MPATLSTTRDQVEQRLGDASNLIFSTETIDEALRAALLDLSGAYGTQVYLKDLDSALATTFDELDHNVLLVGAVAYCLQFRLINKFDQAYPTREDPDELARASGQVFTQFRTLLERVRSRMLALSSDHPYSQWEWEEGEGFS